MTRTALLEQLKAFTEKVTADLIMPTKVQSADEAQNYRPADVYLMRLPDGSSATKKAPYIIHQLLTSKDQQPSGERVQSSASVRSIFVVYNDDEQEGGLMLLNLMERLRIELLRTGVLDNRFSLDLSEGLEYMVYPDTDTAPFYAGEMSSTWKLIPVQREVDFLHEQFQS
jgi:hypothetical protein